MVWPGFLEKSMLKVSSLSTISPSYPSRESINAKYSVIFCGSGSFSSAFIFIHL